MQVFIETRWKEELFQMFHHEKKLTDYIAQNSKKNKSITHKGK